MTFTSYSQNFEDVLLWRALGGLEKGCYIDIGAQDPIQDSVSLAFHKAGWHGIHVEPTPTFASLLRTQRPGDTVLEAAVTDAPGPITLYELGGLSSGREDIADFHRRSGHDPKPIQVPTVRLDRILDLAKGEIHWLKIDVEGMEADVLRSWGSNARRPWILVIEATFPVTETPTECGWIDEVTSRDYKETLFDGLSRYFVHRDHEELRTKLNRPANVFDNFQLTSRHFAAASLASEADQLRAELENRITQLGNELTTAGEQLHRLDIDLLQERAKGADERRKASAEFDALKSQIAAELERRSQLERELIQVAALVTSAGGNLSLGSVADATRKRLDELSAQIERTRDEARGEMERIQNEARGEMERIQDEARRERERMRDDARAQFHKGKESRGPEIAFLIERIGRLREALDSLQRSSESERSALTERIADQQRELSDVRAQAAAFDKAFAHARGEIMELFQRRGPRVARLLRLLPSQMPDFPPSHGYSGAVREDADARPDQIDTDGHRHEMESAVSSVHDVEELLMLNGTKFVDSAYRIFLKRAADRTGREHFLERLRVGHPKEVVLLAIADSAEGRAVSAHVAGLQELRRRSASQHRATIFGFGKWSAQVEARLNRIEFRLGEAHNGMADRLDQLEANVDQVRSRIADISSAPNSVSSSPAGRKEARQSIKRGLKVEGKRDPQHFIESLQRQLKNSSEAETLGIR